MRDKLIVWSILVTLMIISILPGFAPAQVVSNSVNTPSGYSIDAITGNLISYDSSIKSSSGWTTGGLTGSFTPDGYTFSYATGTIEQTVNLANFAHGYQNTGAVFVTGVSYGFSYRFPCANSIGGSCDNTSGPQDNLSATATYYKTDGTVGWTQLHQLGLKNINDGNSAYNPNWQQLAETYTFSGAKSLVQVGTFNLKITGSDAGYWACLGADCYGPQVKDAFVRANYSVDPCILNPAYNPSCPGFSTITQGAQSPLYTWGYDIAKRLPHIGGGVQLYGFDYGFSYYAGDYCTNTFLFWCTSSSGANGGTITFRITDKNNQELFKDSNYREGNYSGGSYSNRYLFTETQNSLNLGGIQWYATNVWGGNFQWVGWSRPIWSPDPCYTQPLYSPNCSNFDVTIKKLAEDQEAARQVSLSNTITSSTTTPTSTITTTLADTNTTNPSVNVVTSSLPPPGSPPPPPGSQPSPPGSQPPLPVVQTTTRNAVTVSSNDNVALALSIINKNRENDLQVSGLAQQAVAEAQTTATGSTREAERIADNLTAASIASSVEAFKQAEQTTGSVQLRATNTSNFSIVQGPAIQPQISSPQQLQQIIKQETQEQQQTGPIAAISLATAIQILAPNAIFRGMEPAAASTSTFNTQQAPRQQQQQEQTAVFQQQQETVTTQEFKLPEQPLAVNQPVQVMPVILAPQITVEASVSQQVISAEQIIFSLPEAAKAAVQEVEQPQQPKNFTTDKTNPINDILETKPLVAEQRSEQQVSQVNRSAQNSEVAVGVDINNIAALPVGFSAYNIALKDVAFYQPREIYRNQRTVDNRRALQNLRSDQLHQQMIEQQWR